MGNYKSFLTQYLKTKKKAEVKEILSCVATQLISHVDFYDAISEEKISKEHLGQGLGFDEDTVYLIDSVADYANPECIKLQKLEILEKLDELLSDEAILEFFMITAEDEALDTWLDIDESGIVCRIMQDPVFSARRGFYKRINEYYQAAMNLYGVIAEEEFLNLVKEYEKEYRRKSSKKEIYVRAERKYKNTMVFNPRNFGKVPLQLCMENMVNGLVTFDGLLIHYSFQEEYELEMVELLSKMESDENQNKPSLNMGLFLEQHLDVSYRKLYIEASEKPMYSPDRETFIQYADADYREETPAVFRFKEHLLKNYRKQIEEQCDVVFETPEMVLDNVLWNIRYFMSRNDAETCFDMDADFVQPSMEALDEIGVPIHKMNLDELNTILPYIMMIKNEERCWLNHGYSPEYIGMRTVKSSGKPTIVPGSSHARKMLEEGQADIEKMGFSLDLDGDAKDIPYAIMPNGMSGQVITGTKKIYPNDPCPCGSGKKYKKCCGK